MTAMTKDRFDKFFEWTSGSDKDLAQRFQILLDLAETHPDVRNEGNCTTASHSGQSSRLALLASSTDTVAKGRTRSIGSQTTRELLRASRAEALLPPEFFLRDVEQGIRNHELHNEPAAAASRDNFGDRPQQLELGEYVSWDEGTSSDDDDVERHAFTMVSTVQKKQHSRHRYYRQVNRHFYAVLRI